MTPDVPGPPYPSASAVSGRSSTLRFGPAVLRVVSFGSILGVWLLLTELLGSALLPGPLETVGFAAEQFGQGALTHHLWATIRRVLLAFGAAMLLGLVVGIAMGVDRRVERLLEGWLIVGLTIPRIVLFVIAYLMLGLNEFAIIVALLLTIVPNIVVQIREGARALDPGLTDMARVYRRPRVLVWRRVILPQLVPHIAATARSSLSISWRLVVLGEILGRTSGVGYQIQFYFQMFNMTGILAYGMITMIVLGIVDLALMGALQRRSLRWRQTA